MPWQPLPRIAVAIAMHPFAAEGPADLPLEVGDDLYLIEQGGKNNDWYRGYLVAPPSLVAGLTSGKGKTLEARVFHGIFPKANVDVREHLQGTSSEIKLQDPFVDGEPSASPRAGHRSPQRQNPAMRKSLAHRKASELSLAKAGADGNGEAESESLNSRWPTSSPAPNSTDATNPPPLTRSLSHRSLKGSQLRSSPDMSSYPLDVPQDAPRKRPQAPVPMLKIGDETPTSVSQPLIDEIASSLREWHSKDIHEMLLARKYKVLDEFDDLWLRVERARRQLMAGVLTKYERKQLHENVVWDLVDGNKMLSGEVIVRDPQAQGRLLTSDDSAFDMSVLQSNMSLLDRPTLVTPETNSFAHLFVELTNFGATDLISPTMTLHVFQRQIGMNARRQMTESFAIDLAPFDSPQRPEITNKMRAIFPDLITKIVGDTNKWPIELFLVVKVQASFPIEKRTVPTTYGKRGEDQGKTRPATSSPATSFSKGSRQSLMWAQKSFGSVRNRSVQDGKPPGSARSENLAPPAEETSRPSTQDSARSAGEKSVQYVRRTAGAAIFDLEKVFKEESGPVDLSSHLFTPISHDQAIGADTRDSSTSEILGDNLLEKHRYWRRVPNMEQIQIRFQLYRQVNFEDLFAKNPSLHAVTVSPKLEFTDVPKEPRSDIYVLLDSVNLPFQALLSHPERGKVQLPSNFDMSNIQLTLEVRKSSGQRIENCIVPSSDSEPVKAWRSLAVSRGEPWKQMIKLSVPPEDVPDAHMIMSLADAPGFPFALCYMPLWVEGAFVKDGSHSPLLYLYDKSTSGHENGRGAYLDFPWSSRGAYGDEKDEALTGPVATLNLQTRLNSTHFSQDKTLLGILNWRSQSKAQTIGLVKKISFVPEIEIVKLIDEVLDALFSIMVNQSGEEEHEDAVFAALVTSLSIIYDRRFNLEPHLDLYAEERFDHPYVAPCLIRTFAGLLADHNDLSRSRQVRSAFKVGRHIIKFILSARGKQEAKEAGIGASTQPSFRRDIKGIFKSLEDLVKDPSPALIGNKTLAVQHMSTWLLELKSTFSEEEIMQLASSFVDACADVQGKLILYKLVLILKLLENNIVSREHVRSRIVTNTVKWIAPYWGSIQNVNQQWREQIRLCSSIVSRQVQEPGFDGLRYIETALQSYISLMSAPRSGDTSFSALFPTAYPFPSKPTKGPMPCDEALVELAALLPSLTNQPFAHAADLSSAEVADLVSSAIDIVTSILNGTVFPKNWLSLYLYHHKTMLRFLDSILDLMCSRLLPPPEEMDLFNTALWSKYLNAVLLLARSDTLALETFPEQKRRAVWKIAGDVREQGASLLRRSWEAIGWDSTPEDQKRYDLQRLGGFQVQYVPGLVFPVVELCLSVHEGLRKVAVKILQSMIISEWTLNEDLAMVQAEMIESLDNLYKTKGVANSLVQKMFVNELLDAFEHLARMPLDPLWQAIRDMVSIVDDLLELLTAVHGDDTDESSRTMDTLMLMNFYKDLQKEDIFIRYVHQLAESQSALHNKTEAGLALQLHADLYTWETTTVRALNDPSYPEQTSFERKEALNFEMIKYFEEGSAWDRALISYRDLAHQYESVYYDFSKLARTQRAMATIYEMIGRGDWSAPRFFRVIYMGLGFQENMRDRQYIYQGEPYERQSAFTDRLRQMHPSAQILLKDEPEDMEGQYLQVQPVSVYRDIEHAIYQQPKIAQSTREYVTAATPYRFAVTSKRHSPASGVQDQWIEKTVYTTQESFPTILRRSEIVSIETVQLTPLQTAVERTTRKNAELATLEKRVNSGDEAGVSNLTEAIISSVDPASVAKVAQYRQLLPVKPEEVDDAEPEEPLPPMENALQIALLDHVSTLKLCLAHYTDPVHSGTYDSLTDNLNQTYAPELALLQPPVTVQPEAELQDLLSTPPSTSAGAASFTTFPAPVPNGAAAPTPDAVQPKDKTTAPKSRINFTNFKSSFSPAPPTAKSSTKPPEASPYTSHSDTAFSSQDRNFSTAASSTALLSPKSGSVAPMPTGSLRQHSQQSNGVSNHRNQQHNGSTQFSAGPVEKNPAGGNTASGAMGKVKKRFSMLGLGRAGSKMERPKPQGMAALGEE